MSAWPQHQQQQQHQSNGVYPGMLDSTKQPNSFDPSSMNGMYNGNAFNPQQFNNQGMQQQHVNPQAAFGNQTFNVGSVIPSKRPRDDVIGMSPGPPQNTTLGVSRSHTPMQQGTPFQGNQPFPTPYQHLQQGSNNATPSPTMANQQFRPPQPPPRMTTASPAQFSQMGQGQNAQGQMSPSPSHQNNQQMSPQLSQQTFSPNLGGGASVGGGAGFGQGFGNQGMMNQNNMASSMPGMMNNSLPNHMAGNMANNMSSTMSGAGMNMNASAMQAQLQQRQYQQRFVQQQQRLQAQAQTMGAQGIPGQSMGGQGMGAPGMPAQRPMGNQMVNPAFTQDQQGQGMPNGQQMQPTQPGQPQQQGQQQGLQQEKARQWLHNLQIQCQQQGKPFQPFPVIAGRPINLYALWMHIAQLGGSMAINQRNMWPVVAQRLGFPNQSTAPQEIRQAFDTYLSTYERSFMLAKQAQKQQMAQEAARQMAGFNGTGQAQGQGSPAQQMPQGDGTQGRFPQGQQQPQPPLGMPGQTPQPNQLSRQGSISTANGMSSAIPSTPQNMPQPKRTPSMTKPPILPPQDPPTASPAPDVGSTNATNAVTPMFKKENSIAPTKPAVQESEYEPKTRSLDTFGGYDMTALIPLTTDLSRRIPDVPSVFEMGVIDMRSINLSLQSGLPHETRRALDDLVQITVDPRILLELDKCDDLVDVLVECAEAQIDRLAEAAEEVSDAVDLSSYEEVLRSCRSEAEDLYDLPPFGSLEHDLEQASARLIALTTIFRNLSFNEHNHPFLATSAMITLLSNTIRLLGTRHMLLRSHQNVADFYKDAITFLSNTAQALELPSKDDALHILHFLLAFAPQPAPSIDDSENVRFSTYHPVLHRYTSHAVDSLAKVLARTEPNRSFYRQIFTTSSSSPDEVSPSELLTRTFGLAVSVLPDRSKIPLSSAVELRLVEARKPLLTQGMLAADIVATLVPTAFFYNDTETPVNIARVWLESDDRWATSLLRMVYLLATDPTKSAAQQRQLPTRLGPDGRLQPVDTDPQGYGFIIHRGLSMLNRLVEKAFAGPAPKLHKLSASINGVSEESSEAQDVNAINGTSAPEHDDNIESLKLSIKGDPLPHRETVLGALLVQNADKEAIRIMSKLYDMIIS
ncbi:hypothetical protein MBLNU457_3166t1 [Dothideomycetes sp. NU457]